MQEVIGLYLFPKSETSLIYLNSFSLSPFHLTSSSFAGAQNKDSLIIYYEKCDVLCCIEFSKSCDSSLPIRHKFIWQPVCASSNKNGYYCFIMELCNAAGKDPEKSIFTVEVFLVFFIQTNRESGNLES